MNTPTRPPFAGKAHEVSDEARPDPGGEIRR
jgi:hypothetical protein